MIKINDKKVIFSSELKSLCWQNDWADFLPKSIESWKTSFWAKAGCYFSSRIRPINWLRLFNGFWRRQKGRDFQIDFKRRENVVA